MIMKRFLAIVTAVFLSFTAMYGEEVKADAVVLTHDAVFTMNSMSTGTYKVHSKIQVNSRHGADAALFSVLILSRVFRHFQAVLRLGERLCVK